MARVVIIGAGLTGLSAAYHLEQQGMTDYQLLEKEAEVGGLCRSVRQNGFTFDYTGHLLHISDPYVKTLIDSLIGLSQFNYIKRESAIYSHGVYTRYPFQINLFGLPPAVIAECISGFVQRKKCVDPQTFHSWVLTHFGAGFAKNFFFPYQHKLFCTHPKKFTATWTGRFVPQTTLEDIVVGALTDRADAVGYNSYFYYPRCGGIDIIPNTFAQALHQPAQLKCEIVSIDLNRKIVTCANGAEYRFDRLITTMPLSELLAKIIDTSTTAFSGLQRHLIASSVLNFNVGVARNNFSDNHWMYFPERHYPFYRAGCAHLFGDAMAPQGHSLLYGECAYRGTFDNGVLEHAINKTCELFSLERDDITMTNILNIPCAYVVYTRWRDNNIEQLLARLRDLGIYSIGRYGSWKYASMQEAILDGRAIAQELVTTI
jgi:protoporphyrinogen oxidase